MRSLMAVMTFIGAVVLVLALRACYTALEQKALEIKSQQVESEKTLEICKKQTQGRILTQTQCDLYHDCLSYGSNVETCVQSAMRAYD